MNNQFQNFTISISSSDMMVLLEALHMFMGHTQNFLDFALECQGRPDQIDKMRYEVDASERLIHIFDPYDSYAGH